MQRALRKVLGGVEVAWWSGVTRSGLTRSGVTRRGVTRSGVTRSGVTRSGVTRSGGPDKFQGLSLTLSILALNCVFGFLSNCLSLMNEN